MYATTINPGSPLPVDPRSCSVFLLVSEQGRLVFCPCNLAHSRKAAPMPNWTVRDISRDAAAAALNLNVNTLDLWLHRYKSPSGKVGGARVFSLHDLTVLQTARQLIGPDIIAVRSMEIAVTNILDPPDDDDAIFVTASQAWMGTRHDPWPERPCTIVNVGWVRKAIEQQLEALDVAI